MSRNNNRYTDSHCGSVRKIILSVISLLVFNFVYVYAGWVDPDTDESDKLTKSFVDNREYKLVFSDEFEVENRYFRDGEDPRWTAIHKDDYTNFALHYYNKELARTSNGKLNISTIVQDVTFSIDPTVTATGEVEGPRQKTKNYQSAMIQGWNKFCFTGGIVEMSAQLPGKWDVGGLWPAMWLLGNLARATYVGSSNNLWPWSYNTCNRRIQHQQEISACKTVNYFGMHSKQGRGAPEIDILESMSGNEQLIHTTVHRPYFSTSLQIAPGYEDFRPDVASRPPDDMWYRDGIEYAEGNETDLNVFFYGMNLEGSTKEKSYIADALSANTNLYETHFTNFHKYRLEWVPGENGYLKWFLDDKFLYGIHASALNLTGGIIPEEPMYLLLNTAVSSTWGFPMPCPEGCPCDCFDPRKLECFCAIPPNMIDNFPAHFLLDYVRVYQAVDDDTQVVGCSTLTHPSSTFIKGNKERYMGKHDKEMMKTVARGDAPCKSDSDCTAPGRDLGSCEKNRCICNAGFTGPRCLAAEAYDDIIWDKPEHLSFEGFMIPTALVVLAVLVLIVLFISVIWRYRETKAERAGYTKIDSNSPHNPNSSVYSFIEFIFTGGRHDHPSPAQQQQGNSYTSYQ